MKTLRIKVKPNAKNTQIQPQIDGSLIVSLKAPPIEGKANQELITVLAKFLAIKKSQISIKSGLTSKHKLVVIDDG